MSRWDFDNERDEPMTTADAVRHWVYAVGADWSREAWILSPYDTWERNPHYRGFPVPHPESAEARMAEEEIRSASFVPTAFL